MNKYSTVAIFAPNFPPAYLGGGPIRTLDALVRDAPEDVQIFVVTSDRDLGGGAQLAVVPNEWVARADASVFYMSTNRFLDVFRAFSTVRREKPDVVYLNSFFNTLFSIIPQLLSRVVFVGHPRRLLAPRGEFSKGALAIKPVKKRAFIALYRMLRLHRGVIWHASGELEAANIREVWGPNAEILIREDETNLPVRAVAPALVESTGLHAIFLGRIVPNKGLLVILEALQSATAQIQLDIYGGEEDAHYSQECRRAAASAAPNVCVRFMGSVLPHDVFPLFSSSELFLMPTAGENFGHVIAEALSASCPVMCTATTPWTDLLVAGGGKIVPSSNAVDWRDAIDSYAMLSGAERLDRRVTAGKLYERWRAEPKGPHVFQQLKTFSSRSCEALTREV